MIPRYAPVPVRSGSPSSGSSARPRGLALLVAALALAALVLGTGVVVRPLWWRLKADLSEHGPEQHRPASGVNGGGKASTAATPAKMAAAVEAMAGSNNKGAPPPSKVRMDNKAGETPAAVEAAAKAKAAAAAKEATSENSRGGDAKAAPATPPAAAKPAPAMDDAARQALLERLAKMTPDQLERAREQAREQQWDDAWWSQYQKAEAARREQLAKQTADGERRTVARYNLTLNAETAAKLAHPDGKYVFVTWANSHYTDFALSWAHHLRSVGLGDHMVVGAMDDPVLYSLAKRRIAAFAMQGGESFFGVVVFDSFFVAPVVTATLSRLRRLTHPPFSLLKSPPNQPKPHPKTTPTRPHRGRLWLGQQSLCENGAPQDPPHRHVLAPRCHPHHLGRRRRMAP